MGKLQKVEQSLVEIGKLLFLYGFKWGLFSSYPVKQFIWFNVGQLIYIFHYLYA